VNALEPVAGDGALLGEGPVWDVRDRSLLWVDILRGEAHRFRPDDGSDEVILRSEQPVAAVAVRARGGLVFAIGLDVVALDGRHLASADRGDRLNEARCDPAGRWWTGTLTDDQRPGASALYRLGADGRFDRVLDGVTLSNGTGWSPDGTTMYYVDTTAETIDAFDFDVASGEISGRRTFVDLHDVPGRPDGLSVDVEGGVWVAMARGWAVRRYGPDGALERVLDVPCARVTSCAFGSDDLTDLYVTTASDGLSDADRAEQPHAGALFRCAAGVAGLPVPAYAG
jgi:sugar lactone lactonase YvrE